MENFAFKIESEKQQNVSSLDVYRSGAESTSKMAVLDRSGSNVLDRTYPNVVEFSPIQGFDKPRISEGDQLIASRIGAEAFNECQRTYERTLREMTNAGHHLPGGDIASGFGNILQNSGLSNKTWVCAEQAEYLARALRNDPALRDSKVFLLHTKDYEHMFVGVQDPDGKMIYMDPWREKGPSRQSPNEIEGSIEFH